MDVERMRLLIAAGRVDHVLKALASARLTLAFFLLMAAASLASVYYPEHITAFVTPPLALLLLNLVAAILSVPRFRADLPLLLLHLALLALVALMAGARLYYFKGVVRLSAGAEFKGEYMHIERGPLHGDDASRLRFANEGLKEYAPPGGWPVTYNRVRWEDSDGSPQWTDIGNDRYLVLDGYRIYATKSRGFEPMFEWHPTQGGPELGTVAVPYTFADDFPEAITATLPGGKEVWVQLISSEKGELDGTREDLGAHSLAHTLTLRADDQRFEMKPGTSVELSGGRLTYRELGTWMIYRVVYDPTPPWMTASVLVGAASLLWFYARLWRKPRPGNTMDKEI
jgi:hypothetical protein